MTAPRVRIVCSSSGSRATFPCSPFDAHVHSLVLDIYPLDPDSPRERALQADDVQLHAAQAMRDPLAPRTAARPR